MIALSSLIGSGWLFGSWEASKMAGPAAILSWIIGGLIIFLIAYNYIEIGTMFPESGGMSKYAQYSHGSLLGFIAAWSNWISLITIIPIEAVATVQYMSNWPWSWARFARGFLAHGVITNAGLLVVILIIIIFTLINYWSVTLMANFTSLISFFKIGLPILTILVITFASFHPSNYGTNMHQFFPYGTAPVLAATSSAGIIFSFNAFQTIINMGSEIEKPEKYIGKGIVLSLLISGIIYIFLQSAFITAMPHSALAQGWKHLNFESPFADLAIVLGINWLAILLYIDAFVSPFGTGVSFVASASRALAAMESNQHLPKFVGHISSKYRLPRAAMVVNACLSIVMVFFFRSWSLLTTVLSAATLIAYLMGPVTAVSLRKLGPQLYRPIKLKALKVISPLAFVLTSLAIYWSLWPTTIEVIGIILLGLPLYLFYEQKQHFVGFKVNFRAALWMIVYLFVLSVISYLGSRHFGGINWLTYPWDQVVVIISALVFYEWGIKSAVKTKDLQEAFQLNALVQKSAAAEEN